MRVAGLTGGIATGKSTVSNMLRIEGAIIVDADAIARDVVRKDLPAWRKIKEHFGEGVLLGDGEIDRIGLGKIIFNSPDQKKELDSIVHPLVMTEVAEKLHRIEQQNPAAVVVLDVPLLIEAGMHHGLADIIVVYISESRQLARLMARDKSSAAEAMARIRSQMPIEEKKRFATILIDNSGDLAQTRKQTIAAYQQLKVKQS